MTAEDLLRSVRSQATELARGWSPPNAPRSWALTCEIFTLLAGDEDLLELAAEIREDRMPALLFCAAARYLVDKYEPPDLLGYFPVPGMPRTELDAGFGPAFRAFCLEHRKELLALCRRRRYQMNEVARSTQVALALGVIAQRRPAVGLALIDLGAGAGLCLHLDRYRHELSDGRGVGDPTSSLVLRCETTGRLQPPVPSALPPIEWRVGVDLDPVDLADPDELRWVRACVPPERDSVERFERAVRLARVHPCAMVRGDAIEVLPEVLDSVPEPLFPVVVDTYTAVFFSNSERVQFREVLRQRAAARDLAWVSLDPLVPLGTAGRYSVQGLDVPGDLVAEYQRGGVFALLGLVRYAEERQSGALLARAHPSGTNVTWLDHGFA